jgi:iron complex outermembrane receptor protein
MAGGAVLAALAPSLLAAQASPPDSLAKRDSVAQRLNPVNVRATRSARSDFGSPLAITTLTRGDFAGKNGFGLNDAMANVPGALVQSRYGTADVRITIRGFGARGAGDRSNAGTSRGIRVLLDGMPETEPDGRTSFDNIDLAATEGLQVIRSNSSALWGNAAGGVVSLSTVPTIDRAYSTLQYMGGSFGMQRYVAQMGAPLGNGGVAYASYTNTTFDGWRVNSDARRALFNGGVAAPIGDHTLLRVHLLAANNLMHIPGPLSPAQYEADPKQANATYNTRDERRYNRLGRLGVAVEHSFDAKQSVSAMAFVNPKFLQRSERGTFRDFTRYHFGGNAQYNRVETLGGKANRLTIGIDQAYQDGAILFYGLTAAGTRARDLRDNKKEGAYNSGLFVEDELAVHDQLSVTVGARADAINYYSATFIGDPKLNASKRFSRVTPKLGATWRLTPTHTFYANVGGGIEAPAGNETDPASTFGQDTITAINPLLEPIRSTTYEVGSKHVWAGAGFVQSVTYDVAAYLTNVTNEIVPYRGGRFYFTAGEARRTGLELGVQATAQHGLSLKSAITLSKNTYEKYLVDSVHYNAAKAGVFADYSGNEIVGVPGYFYSTALAFAPAAAPAGLGLQLGLQGTGQYFADDANAVKVPESHILSLSLRADRLLHVGDTFVRGFVSIENLTDRKWVGSAFLNPDVVSGAPLVYEPGMPRSVLVSFSVSRGR